MSIPFTTTLQTKIVAHTNDASNTPSPIDLIREISLNQITREDEPIEIETTQTNNAKNCTKCKLTPFTLKIKTNLFCNQCFIQSITLKFKQNLTKSNLNEQQLFHLQKKVIIAATNSNASHVLIHLINTFRNKNTKIPTQRFSRVEIVHVFDTRIISPSKLVPTHEDMTVIDLQSISNDSITELFKNKSITAVNQLKSTLILHLLNKHANLTNCDAILLAQDNTSIAIDLLVKTICGNGFGIEFEGLLESGFNGMRLVRLLYNIERSEIDWYFKIMKLGDAFSLSKVENEEDTPKDVSVHGLTHGKFL